MRGHLRSNPPSCSTGELPPGASTSLFLISLSKLPRTAWQKPGPMVWVWTSCVGISCCTVPDVTRTCRLRAKGCTTMVSGQVSSAHSVKPLALRADGTVHVIFHGRAASIMAPLVLHARAKLRSREPVRAPPLQPSSRACLPRPSSTVAFLYSSRAAVRQGLTVEKRQHHLLDGALATSRIGSKQRRTSVGTVAQRKRSLPAQADGQRRRTNPAALNVAAIAAITRARSSRDQPLQSFHAPG